MKSIPGSSLKMVVVVLIAAAGIERARAADMSAYLEQRQSSPVDGLQQLIWALVNNPEFRFNH